MDREKLLQNPLPVDRVAYRVVKKARPEDCWRPMPTIRKSAAHSANVLATKPLPPAAHYELRALIGRKRGRMQVMGYAADQGSQSKSARWVVRCDCGNFEHRSRILRWLATDGDDMCVECQMRASRLGKQWVAVKRNATSLDGFIASVYEQIDKCAQSK